jgi:death-on-curing protein
MMRNLSIANVILLHQKLINQTGGSHGVRDKNLVESAIARAFATFDGNDLYEAIEDKVAAITFGLVNNHGFVDGNKRIGVAAMLLLLKLNGYSLKYSQQELIVMGISIADGSG